MAKKDTIIGLDIGCYSVKAAWVTQRSNACSVKRVEILKLPYDQSNREEVITSWLAGHGIGKYPCVLGISGQQVMFQPLQMADDDPRTMEQAAEMEVLKFRDITAETMTHGLAPFTLKPEDRRLLMAMARESALNDVLSLARNTRLDIVNLVPSPVALFNTFARMDNANNDGRPCIYANIGHVTTDIAVGIKHSLIFARSFAGGGQMFTIAVARTGHLTETQAEDWKIDKGSVSDDNNNSSAIKATADVWINEIQSCLAVYRNLFPNDETRPTQMIVSGGGSLLKGFPDYIAERLNINVRQPLMLPGNPKTDRPALFPTAIGLALSEDNAAAQINLLPNTIKDELIFRRQKPFWIAAAITAALILGISVACGFWQIKRYKKILNV
ncbi:MAG: pilus assembly protein PilM, partial [Lentisphaerae bacterium]|nr:pilus assembly protein PilM [Lentisphaerota bacterium]